MRSKYTRSQHRTSPIDSYISIELGRQMIYYMTKILFDLKIMSKSMCSCTCDTRSLVSFNFCSFSHIEINNLAL